MEYMDFMEKTYSTTDLNKHLGDVLDAASRVPVGITRHGKTRYVIASVEYFERLKGQADTRRAYGAKDIPQPLLDALLDSNADLLTDGK
jgi:prevent-host-death family protein